MNWLIPANINKYDFISAFNQLENLDWTQKANYNIGDIVYIYGSLPYQKIMYKTEVININIKKEEIIDDEKFWVDNHIPTEDTSYIKLKLISKYDNDKLSLKNLQENGVKRAPQGPMRLKNNTLSYIEKVEMEILLDFIANKNEDLDMEKEAIVKVRLQQGVFRKRLIEKDGKCRICGVNDKRFLIASHIKPWNVSNDMEKIDYNNGLLLCPNHDHLFDKGYISFKENGRIMISKEIEENMRILLNIFSEIKININYKEKKYMKYHRENIFNNT